MRSSVLVAVAVIVSSSPAAADCSKDTDCKGDRICTAGACVDPTDKGKAADPETALERSSPGLFTAGVATLIVGGLALTAGAAFLVVGLASKDKGGMIMGGGVAAGSGALLMPAGIVMMMVGGRRVPADQASVGISQWASPTSGGLLVTGSF